MREYMMRRLAISVLVAAIISMLVFGMIHFIPGDPITAMFGDSPDPAAMATIRSLYGLDKPVPLQYVTWLGNLAQGSLGQSFRLRLPVSELVAERVPRSLLLALGAIL